MRVQAILLGAAGLLLSTAVAAPAAGVMPEEEFDGFGDEQDAELDRLAKREPCHPEGLHVIGASGAGANNFHNLGLLDTTLAGILALIPKSTNISLPYPKAAAAYGAPDPIPALTRGTHNLRRYIRKFHARCPNSPIGIMGYSAGAIMTTNNICGGMGVGQLPAKYQNNIIAAVGYGDETFVSGQSWDRGTCTSGQGLHPRDPATCDFFAAKMQSYCDSLDPDCCIPGGGDTDAHFAYPGEYDGDVAAFMQSQWQKWASAHGFRH